MPLANESNTDQDNQVLNFAKTLEEQARPNPF